LSQREPIMPTPSPALAANLWRAVDILVVTLIFSALV
jgi:hypothetical protein